MRNTLAALCLLASQLAFGQVAFPIISEPVAVFSFEDKDWQVAAPTSPKRPPYHAPTPISIPGARVIKTLQLKSLLAETDKVVIVDVLDSKNRTTLPGAYWLPGAGDGQFFAAEKARFAGAMEKLTGGDKNRPVVFLC